MPSLQGRTDLSSLGPTVSVWAHPDDETYLAGGVSAALRDHGVRVVCVTATRGEAGGRGSDSDSRAALGRVRTRELEEALAVLGVDEHRWLGHQDGECAQVDPDSLRRRSRACSTRCSRKPC